MLSRNEDEGNTTVVPSPLGRRGRLRRALLGLSVALCILGLAGCAGDSTPIPSEAQSWDVARDQVLVSTPATPLFYRIDGGPGATLLLLGTVHLGPEEGWVFSEALRDGLEHADSFVLELDLRKIREESVASRLAELVVIESPKTLLDLVSPETAKVIAENDTLLTELGLPANARKRLKPWYIAMGLVESTTQRAGLTTKASAESIIEAAIGSKPVLGLETFEEQLALLNGIDPTLQDMMLRDTLSRLDEAVADTRDLTLAWHRGDVAYFEKLAREGVDEMPEFDRFYEIILGDRNRRWMPKLRSLLDDPERKGEFAFVGVGALHLVLEDGLLELFRQSGYRVSAIDHGKKIEVRSQ